MVLDQLAGVGIKWVFTRELRGGGGVFERMVKSTKRCLKKMIGSHLTNSTQQSSKLNQSSIQDP